MNRTEPIDPLALLENSEELFSTEKIEREIQRIAADITRSITNSQPLLFCLMNGGIVLTGQLIPLLTFPLAIDYIHPTRYGDNLEGGAINWIYRPERDLNGRTVLLIDDIFDEGKTLANATDWCFEQGAESVYAATLCNKQHSRKVQPKLNGYFNALEVPDQFVFGYGMDCHGLRRNLSSIRTLL